MKISSCTSRNRPQSRANRRYTHSDFSNILSSTPRQGLNEEASDLGINLSDRPHLLPLLPAVPGRKMGSNAQALLQRCQPILEEEHFVSGFRAFLHFLLKREARIRLFSSRSADSVVGRSRRGAFTPVNVAAKVA